MTPEERKTLCDPTSNKKQKQAICARFSFRAASASRLLRRAGDNVGADGAAFVYEMYYGCMTLPKRGRGNQT